MDTTSDKNKAPVPTSETQSESVNDGSSSEPSVSHNLTASRRPLLERPNLEGAIPTAPSGSSSIPTTTPSSSTQQPGPSTSTAGEEQPPLYVTDRHTGRQFVVDSQCQISMIPFNPSDQMSPGLTMTVTMGATETPISIYAVRFENLNLGFGRVFPCVFAVANVPTSILGVDILRFFGLRIDMYERRLVYLPGNLMPLGMLPPILPVVVQQQQLQQLWISTLQLLQSPLGFECILGLAEEAVIRCSVRPPNPRIFVIDQNSSHTFVIDSGCRESMIPAIESDRISSLSQRYYFPGGSSSNAYGPRTLSLNLSPGQNFNWDFRTVDGVYPVIGADFLAHFDLLVDVRHSCLYFCPCNYTSRGNALPNPPSQSILLWEAINYYYPHSIACIDRVFGAPCLWIADRNTGTLFLIDSGAESSVIPPMPSERMLPDYSSVLTSGIGTSINTYGRREQILDLGLGQPFRWTFVVADTDFSILGADFLRQFGLLIDHRHKRLLRPRW